MAASDYDMGAAQIDDIRDPKNCIMQKFRLYETRSKFYMIGRNKSRTIWRVMKIDRLEPTELNISEDPTTYTEAECYDLLTRIHEGNKATGGLKFVTTCYGIIGFIKFLGPHYMLLITKRRKLGSIGGHTIYGISKSEMIPIPNPTVRSNMAYSKNENRYKKLLCTVDLTKDFFFSYSYHVMCSLQRNLCDSETEQDLYRTMFVWNEFLTRGIRNNLKNTLWTVALVHGFFKQAKLSISGRDFSLTLIARRSRLYAGTRYRKRGVNEKGRVANDVETEQIVVEDLPEGCPVHISSVVQNRGSIPLFWSQETSRVNIRPDIILSKKDKTYEATRIHFDNLVTRYGNPIIILNLIKTREKKPRESKLRREFAYAIQVINKDLPKENRLKFLHLDLHKHSRSKGTNVLELLGKVAEDALKLTGFFHSQLTILRPERQSYFGTSDAGVSPPQNHLDDTIENVDNVEVCPSEVNSDADGGELSGKLHMLQKGVLRTNCIDCLDRTNVAQYAYGLVALGHQLHALGFINTPKIHLNAPLADDLMRFYEIMGDTLAFQYGGSAAHNKIFSERRGQWKAATQTQELCRTIQRYYSNAYMDGEKQDAINIFLGYFQPQQDKPALWELDSDQHFNVGWRVPSFGDENSRLSFKRSLSDGNICCESDNSLSATNVGQRTQGDSSCLLSEATPEISTLNSDISYSRYTPGVTSSQIFTDMQSNQIHFHEDIHNCSNFVDVDWLSSAGNSCDEDHLHEMSKLLNSPISGTSSENVVSGMIVETTTVTSENESSVKGKKQTKSELSYDPGQSSNVLTEYSDRFMHWVTYGETLCY